ncbi:MAG: hypothetical protein HY064_13595 [Bacteroidetes bacterium]|nr:hypothetical protein [Bacteroidota bacterium]
MKNPTNILRKTQLLCLLFLLTLQLSAQVVTDEYRELIDSNAVITSSSEDQNYQWIGTDKGLWKINKKTKKAIHYDTENIPLESNFITSVCCCANGNVWIGTPKGAIRFDGFAFLTVNDENSDLPDNYITSIVQEKNGTLWIGTRYGGLVKIDRNKYTVYDHTNSAIKNDHICKLSLDVNGNILVDVFMNGQVSADELVTRPGMVSVNQ